MAIYIERSSPNVYDRRHVLKVPKWLLLFEENLEYWKHVPRSAGHLLP